MHLLFSVQIICPPQCYADPHLSFWYSLYYSCWLLFLSCNMTLFSLLFSFYGKEKTKFCSQIHSYFCQYELMLRNLQKVSQIFFQGRISLPERTDTLCKICCFWISYVQIYFYAAVISGKLILHVFSHKFLNAQHLNTSRGKI